MSAHVKPAAPGATALDWFNAASPLLGGILGGGSSAPPSSSDATQRVNFDSSGFTVATGHAKAGGANTGYMGYALIGAGLLLGILYFKRKK